MAEVGEHPWCVSVWDDRPEHLGGGASSPQGRGGAGPRGWSGSLSLVPGTLHQVFTGEMLEEEGRQEGSQATRFQKMIMATSGRRHFQAGVRIDACPWTRPWCLRRTSPAEGHSSGHLRRARAGRRLQRSRAGVHCIVDHKGHVHS